MTKKNLKGIARLLLFTLVFGLFLLFAGVHLVDTDLLTGVTLREMQSRDDIDLAFVGSSVTLYHFNPAILRTELGMETFNCAVQSASLQGVTALTRELFAASHPDYVVLVVEPYNFDTAKESIETQYRMLPFLHARSRLPYVLSCARLDGLYLERLLPFRGMFPSSPENLYKTWLTQADAPAAFLRYAERLNPAEHYMGAGFLRHDADPEGFEKDLRAKMYAEDFEGDYYPLLDDSVALLDAYRETVAAQGAQLLVVICPNIRAHALAEPSFLPYTQSLMAYCREHEVPIFNFQYAKPELMPCLDDHFFDIYHMDGEGADLLTAAFARCFTLWQQGADYASLFYANSWLYQDSLQVITNTWVWPDGDGAFTAGANVDFHSHPEFAFSLIEDGKETPLRDFDEDPHIEAKVPDGAQLRVYARRAEDPEGDVVSYDYPRDFWFAKRMRFSDQ